MNKAFLLGFFGDLGLQTINKYTDKGKEWGLDTYFAQHGPIESLFIASGMVVGFEMLYHTFFIEKEFIKLFILGGIVDIIFRTTMPMPSLQDYYSKLHPLMSIFWAGFPAMMLKVI